MLTAASPAASQTAATPPSDTERPAASAPEDADRPAAVSGDIVVTARRREERLQDVPISVAVTSGETLQKRGTVDLIDLSTRMPGVHIGQNTTSNNIQLRGVGSGVNGGFEQAVGTFVDGVYRPRSRSVQATLFDIERVEVLNGPQSTFFGNNTVAGAINITTRKPSSTFGYNGQLLYSPTDGQYIIEGGVTGAVTDTLSVRVAGQISGMDGFTYNRFEDMHGPRLRGKIIRGSLRWQPSDTFESDLRLEYVRQRDKGTYYGEIRGCPPPAGYPTVRGPCALYLTLRGPDIDNQFDFRADTGPSSFDLDSFEVAWSNRFDLGPVALNFLTSYSDLDDTTFGNFTPLPITGRGGFFYSPTTFDEKFNMFSQEVRLESQGNGAFNYMVGAYYSRGHLRGSTFSSLFGTTIGAAGAPVTNANTPIGTNRQIDQVDQTRSVFGQLTYKFTPRFRTSLGLRYTSVLKNASRAAIVGIGGGNDPMAEFQPLDLATQAKLYPGSGFDPANYARPRTTYSQLMPSVSVQYDLTSSVTAYATYANGFKAGGYSDSNTPVQFDSESADAYEVGLKGTLFDGRMFFSIDGFLSRFSDLQQAVNIIGPTGASIQSVNNASSATSKGIEFTGSMRVSDVISFNAAASYIVAKFNAYPGAACTTLQIVASGATCTQNLTGKPLGFAPKLTATVGLTVALPVGVNQFRLEPNLFHSSSYFLTAANDPLVFQKGYQQYDMRASFGPSDRSWEIAVVGKNLSNAKVQNTSTVLAASPGLVYSLLQRARSVALSVSIRR
ncbi:TonB-dependent receptor [Sphingomonas sp.]|uniref:TonB-dependent receptor n=1 Tax=Sphingomonas sp. TaxID=28214 RepID=UPI002DD643ED|nr:TonB-dependent receptor [Sphingomonas sp.]